ncbi:rhodanese-related sulfurtransferase [Labedella gwakjiensis]|uniref:Rhodanese-like domain-containing protein n=1 Tax=Labedella gwakjiensis TaxID=390269 RepID=A0A2P8GVM8_9MICO|nr:rhodanese-like domain-containing protein [Labedella gwakjiensis]PSL38009.1 rhodanese-related sulfurtransferase [Labedella gwakjiensis]RUQ87428.1 rhodanese-like domain-containing protein [Labedella gwakjiensis]
MDEISVSELHDLDGVTVIDVREPDEFAGGHVPGAVNVPLQTVPDSLDRFDPEKPVYLICQAGMRSERAATFLDARGFDTVNVTGGTSAWASAGLPLEH